MVYYSRWTRPWPRPLRTSSASIAAAIRECWECSERKRRGVLPTIVQLASGAGIAMPAFTKSMAYSMRAIGSSRTNGTGLDFSRSATTPVSRAASFVGDITGGDAGQGLFGSGGKFFVLLMVRRPATSGKESWATRRIAARRRFRLTRSGRHSRSMRQP